MQKKGIRPFSQGAPCATQLHKHNDVQCSRLGDCTFTQQNVLTRAATFIILQKRALVRIEFPPISSIAEDEPPQNVRAAHFGLQQSGRDSVCEALAVCDKASDSRLVLGVVSNVRSSANYLFTTIRRQQPTATDICRADQMDLASFEKINSQKKEKEKCQQNSSSI